MPRILALDYGLKRTGVATTDPLQLIVTPLETVETTNLESYLKTYFSKEEVEKVVLGLPLDVDGNPTDSTHAVEKFKKQFEKLFSIPIVLQDEYNTSKMASRSMIDGGFKKKHRQKKGNLDMLSAVHILKRYLGEEL